MNPKTIVITGASGFIGRNLVAVLRDRFPDGRVVEFTRHAPAHGDGVTVDLLDTARLERALRDARPDLVFHLAGVVYSSDWRALYDGNVATTVNLLKAVESIGLPTRIVVPGSAAEYGAVLGADLPIRENQPPRPLSPYGLSKVWQSSVVSYFSARGVDAVIGRIFNVIGPDAPEGLSIGAFRSQLRRIKRGETTPEISVGNLAPRRDHVDIADAAAGLIAVAMHGRRGEAYNICSETSVSMDEILRELIRWLGIEVSVVVDPARVRAADIPDMRGSGDKLRAAAGWSPAIPLAASLKAIVAGL